MSGIPSQNLLQIKKYPNRRYYDATRSCHITLQELHDLIVAGYEVVITDSKTGDDITNLVLLQVLLEKDQPKLDLFPGAILHMMIRSDRQIVRSFLERSFGPFMKLITTSQKQFESYWRQAMSGRLVSPFEWADTMMNAFSRGSENNGAPPSEPFDDKSDEPPVDAPPTQRADVDELRQQVALLTHRIEALTAELSNRPSGH